MLGMAGHMQMLDSSGNVILDGSNVDSVSVGYTQDGHASVNFDFDDEGTEAFANATSSTYSGQSISLYLDDTLVVSPQVSSQITDGNVSIPMGGSSQRHFDAGRAGRRQQPGRRPPSPASCRSRWSLCRRRRSAQSWARTLPAPWASPQRVAMVLAIAVLVWRYRLVERRGRHVAEPVHADLALRRCNRRRPNEACQGAAGLPGRLRAGGGCQRHSARSVLSGDGRRPHAAQRDPLRRQGRVGQDADGGRRCVRRLRQS